VRLEWGRGHATVAWDGTLAIDGGEILQTPYWSPEVTDARPHHLSWAANTRTFGEPYGAQRGGIELTLLGPPTAMVTLRTAYGELRAPLGELAGRVTPMTLSCPGQFRIQPGFGGLSSIGGREHRVRFRDTVTEATFYYLRALQIDGEMAWSSPIWVDPK
ncbi:MAG: hypothetical protein ACRDRL_19355, partial [Sciscionella sp.]